MHSPPKGTLTNPDAMEFRRWAQAFSAVYFRNFKTADRAELEELCLAANNCESMAAATEMRHRFLATMPPSSKAFTTTF
jgi:hypothetical protein